MITERITERKAGFAGIIGVITTILTVSIPVLLFDWFVWSQDDLSTLGHIDVQQSYIFNTGLVLTAVFGLIFSIGLYRLEDRQIWRAGTVVYAFSHLAVIWQGVFPAGTPQHNYLSIFPFFLGSLLLLGIDQLRFRDTRFLGLLILSNLFIGVLAVFLLQLIPLEGWAIHETIGVAVFALVSLVLALRMLDVL